MIDCIFCKIVNQEEPRNFEMETEKFVVFKDIHPSAPIHLLIVPKTHYPDSQSASSAEWDQIRYIANKLAEKYNLSGYRLASNFGTAAFVKHMHIHFLGKIKKDRQV